MDNQNYTPNDQQYQAPQYYAPVPAVEERSIVLYIVLSIITCGLFFYYWLYTLTEDLKKLSGDVNATSGGMVILFTILTCGIYLYFWLYKQGDTIDKIKVSRGLPGSSSGILYLILGLFGFSIISYALMQNEINTFVRG